MFERARDAEVGYVAGVFEGEGSVVIRDDRNVRLAIVSTDRDVLDRVTQIVGHGSVRPMKEAGPRNKACWQWYINRRELVMQFMEVIEPLMGERRCRRFADARKVLTRARTRRCAWCNRKFTSRHRKLCSDKCRVEHRRAYHRNRYHERRSA